MEHSAPEDDGSFRHFWEWLHTPHTEEELEEAWEVLKEVKEEQEKEEEKEESKSSPLDRSVVSADPVVPSDWLCGLPLVSPRSLISLFHESINNSPLLSLLFVVSFVHQLLLSISVCLFFVSFCFVLFCFVKSDWLFNPINPKLVVCYHSPSLHRRKKEEAKSQFEC